MIDHATWPPEPLQELTSLTAPGTLRLRNSKLWNGQRESLGLQPRDRDGFLHHHFHPDDCTSFGVEYTTMSIHGSCCYYHASWANDRDTLERKHIAVAPDLITGL